VYVKGAEANVKPPPATAESYNVNFEKSQTRTCNVADRGALCFLLLLGRVIECISQKNVRIAVIARITGNDRIKSFGESYFLHV